MRGRAEIGRQAWLRAKWEVPLRVRVSLAARSNILIFIFDVLYEDHTSSH